MCKKGKHFRKMKRKYCRKRVVSGESMRKLVWSYGYSEMLRNTFQNIKSLGKHVWRRPPLC